MVLLDRNSSIRRLKLNNHEFKDSMSYVVKPYLKKNS